MPNDIIVIGYRAPKANIEYISSKSASGPQTSSQPRAGETGGAPAGSEQSATVNVSVDDPNNLQSATDAAKRYAEALIQTRELLEGLDPNTVIDFPKLRVSIPVSELLKDLNNTRFTVTDNNNFQNKGVGSAVRGANGAPNEEVINFHAISDPGGYGAGTYVNNAGLVGIILHELGHISTIGDTFWKNSISYQRRDPVEKGKDFYNTSYGGNLEAFGNDFMNKVAGAANLNLQGLLPGGRQGAVTPTEIYNSHVPPNKQE